MSSRKNAPASVSHALAFVGLALVLAACGGSASETPFPPEPADVDLGPAGEQDKADAPFRRAAPEDQKDAPAASGSANVVAAPAF